jgi:hypothetical protein
LQFPSLVTANATDLFNNNQSKTPQTKGIIMNMLERRKMKEVLEVSIPEREAEIVEIVGTLIRYEVDEDSFSGDIEGMNFVDNISGLRLSMALRVICADELGKEAVRDGLKLIRLSSVIDESDKKLEFVDGVLFMTCAYSKGLSGAFSDGEIRTVLENGL